MPTKPWSEVLAASKLTPDQITTINAEVDAEIERERMTLGELRRARAMTQATLSQTAGMNQGDVSKLERRSDAYIGTLRRYVEALGGSLHIVAEFPDGAPVEIAGFGEDVADERDVSIPAMSVPDEFAHRMKSAVQEAMKEMPHGAETAGTLADMLNASFAATAANLRALSQESPEAKDLRAS